MLNTCKYMAIIYILITGHLHFQKSIHLQEYDQYCVLQQVEPGPNLVGIQKIILNRVSLPSYINIIILLSPFFTFTQCHTISKKCILVR